ncbi:KaiC domain protein, AF_0351 family [Halorubrum aquaticum]|uniref:KaiC domain protein, AF_0351 family n=1 Tax=Halorubrum aquaticum TaxID=387340 RepID=A0A1I2ZGP2_9EURY|nr:KaiC domain-containing protein [Halorubrum aquaticum]SFH36988.1 KaiC domain protein, AF_0351 family [Halorubrum aquaticum]
MSEEDDWFERALRELDEGSEESDAAESDETDEPGAADESDSDDGDESDDERDRDDGGEIESDGSEPTVDGETRGDDEADRGDDEADRGDDEADRGSEGGVDPGPPESVEGSDEAAGRKESADPFGGYRSERDDDGPAGNDGDDDAFGGGGGGGGGGSFGDDDPFGGGGGGGGGGSFGEDDPFGGGGGSFGEDDPFGGGGGGGGSFGEGGPFGGGGDGDAADGPTGFDETAAEEFDSDIDRTDIGIAGLDEMILGGVPSRSLLTVIGGPGTGKTTFSLQFLNEALESDERGVYITLEQSRESILSTAEEKGWPFHEYAEEGRLAVVSLDPIEMANSLASIRNDLTRLIADFGADRLVLDSVSLLEMMYDHPAKRRSEVFGFTRLLKEAGVTTLLTSEASDETPYASRYGLVEYLTDGVFVLQYVRGSDFRETRLAVEIQKIRDANHSRETKPYEITNAGISVYRQANIF